MLKKIILIGTVAGAITSIWSLADKCKTIKDTKVGRAVVHKFNKIKVRIKHNPKIRTVGS